jgi:hypothetical protein
MDNHLLESDVDLQVLKNNSYAPENKPISDIDSSIGSKEKDTHASTDGEESFRRYKSPSAIGAERTDVDEKKWRESRARERREVPAAIFDLGSQSWVSLYAT